MKSNLMLLLLVFVLGASPGFAQKKSKAKPAKETAAPAQAQPATLPAPVKYTSVEGITEYRLANGLKVLLFPDPSKQTITVNNTYHDGSKNQKYCQTGKAH